MLLDLCAANSRGWCQKCMKQLRPLEDTELCDELLTEMSRVDGDSGEYAYGDED